MGFSPLFLKRPFHTSPLETPSLTSSSSSILSKTLPKESGVTYSLYKEEVTEEGEEKKEPKKFIYIPEVTKEKNIHYFKANILV